MVQGRLLRNRTILTNSGYLFFLAGIFFPLEYILPVQFQSVDGTSASQSGVRLIPLILGVSISTIITSVALTYWCHFKPFLFAGSLLDTVGVICIYNLNARLTTSMWIGLQILTGMGIGMGFQIPLIANQAAVAIDDIPAVTALTLFAENLGTTLFVAGGDAAFTQGLIDNLKHKLPSLDPHTVLEVGATHIRGVFEGGELETVLSSYSHGCKLSYVVSVACGMATCLISMSNAGPAAIKEVRMRLKKSHAG